jgi:hypothetical protein
MINLRKCKHRTGFASGGLTCKLEALCFYSSLVLIDSFVLRKPARTQSPKPLPASLTNDRATMNDRIKHKQMTGQMNHQKADPKANPSVFLFFPNAHFFQTHKWHIWFCPTHEPTLRKTKRAIFCR